jgi:ribosome biogenesis protein SSF1/2
MAGRRKKKRTHIIKDDTSSTRKKIPKSIVVTCGACDKSLNQLVLDYRRIMEPNTASKLKERKNNKLKDYQAIAGPLGVSHFMLFTQTEENLNFRFAVFPNGPTIYYRINEYCLMKDVVAAQLRPHSPGMGYQTSPLVVLSGFDLENPEQKLECTMLQNSFPTVSPSQVKLSNIRRIVLFHRTKNTAFPEETGGYIVQMRHYLITVKKSGSAAILERKLKEAINMDLSHYNDLEEFLQQTGAETSESEREDADNKITLAQKYHGDDNEKNNQRRVKLVELGPRVDLQLIKIAEGLNAGKILYHI